MTNFVFFYLIEKLLKLGKCESNKMTIFMFFYLIKKLL